MRVLPPVVGENETLRLENSKERPWVVGETKSGEEGPSVVGEKERLRAATRPRAVTRVRGTGETTL